MSTAPHTGSMDTTGTLVVSQPMYFPWVGMLEQIRLCDTYVFYDDVQFARGFINRVQVKTRDGVRWLTVPLRDRHRHSLISDLKIDDNTDWRSRHRDVLRQAYLGTPHLDDMLALVDAVFSQNATTLAALSRASVMALAHYFGLDAGRQFLDASALGVGGESSGRLLALCGHFGASRYVTGHGARHYLDHERFERAGVVVEYMDYQLRAYPQRHGAFTPYVSALDLVANCGREGAQYICSRTVSWQAASAEAVSADAILTPALEVTLP
ncbi:WbqC family protein [Cupriavidus metallidurans]|uniref:WbqC family protein n=1 Tax=Cupriavidus TaxID=106589 RepID=UPI0002A1A1E0|nr:MULTISPECIES: WbqC family protein [unclassified Cupriavidus]EKZ98314.1 WbqC family protein [Cupriavidus sp. HMR-1]